MGFVLGPDTYLKLGWNVLDFVLVLMSWLDVIITYVPQASVDVLGSLKVFRALRTLRPLRLVKLAIEALHHHVMAAMTGGRSKGSFVISRHGYGTRGFYQTALRNATRFEAQNNCFPILRILKFFYFFLEIELLL